MTYRIGSYVSEDGYYGIRSKKYSKPHTWGKRYSSIQSLCCDLGLDRTKFDGQPLPIDIHTTYDGVPIYIMTADRKG